MTVSGPVSEPSYRQVSFSADVKQLMLHSKRLPGLLRVDQGKFSWRKNRIGLKEVDASLGNSTISRLSAGFDLGKSPTFEIHSQSVELIADEVYPWLLSFKNIQPYLKDSSVTRGTVALSALNLNGPFYSPAQWQYDLTGNMQNLVLISDAFGDPVTVNNGSFDMTAEASPEAARNRVRMKTTDLTWGKNHLTLFGGMILTKNKTLLDLTLTADAIDWNQVSNIVD